MGRVNNGQMNRIRSNTHRDSISHELRVVRTVAPDQPELFGALALLRETTGNLVKYKDDDELGVTMLMLDPLMRRVFGVGPGQRVPVADLRRAEKDLNERLSHAQYQNYDIPLHDKVAWPLQLYGTGDHYLGIVLSFKDLRLHGDRAIVQQYFMDEYGISRGEFKRHVAGLRPHVTIGEVQYGEMDYEQKAAIRNNPSSFLLGAARTLQERLVEFEGREAVLPVIFPDSIALNGLTIACQPKGS